MFSFIVTLTRILLSCLKRSLPEMLVEIDECDIKFPKNLPSICYLVISCYTGNSAQQLANDFSEDRACPNSSPRQLWFQCSLSGLVTHSLPGKGVSENSCVGKSTLLQISLLSHSWQKHYKVITPCAECTSSGTNKCK